MWTKPGDEILASIARFAQRTLDFQGPLFSEPRGQDTRSALAPLWRTPFRGCSSLPACSGSYYLTDTREIVRATAEPRASDLELAIDAPQGFAPGTLMNPFPRSSHGYSFCGHLDGHLRRVNLAARFKRQSLTRNSIGHFRPQASRVGFENRSQRQSGPSGAG
jgi:hypothetical protein